MTYKRSYKKRRILQWIAIQGMSEQKISIGIDNSVFCLVSGPEYAEKH